MAEREFTYRVVVDGRSAGASAAQARAAIERELNQVRFAPRMGGAGATSVASGGGGGSGRELIPGFGNLGSLAGYTIAGVAISQLGQMVARTTISLTEQGTALRRAENAARQMAGSQERLNELLRAYQEAAGGAQTEGEAMARISQLAAIGFADSADELRRFVVASRGAAQATGHDLNYIMGQLQLSIANQSTQRLDQLGLGVSEVKERINQLKETMPGLTEEARYQEAVLGLLVEKYGGLVSGAEAGASGLELLLTVLRQVREEVARNVEQHTNPLLESWAVGLGAQDAQAQIRQLRRMAETTGEHPLLSTLPGSADQIWAYHRAASLFEEVDAAARNGGEGMSALRSQVQALVTEIVTSGHATEEQIELLGELERMFRLTADGGIVLAQSEEEAGEAAAEAAEKLANLAAETSDAAGELGYLVNIAYSAGAGLDDLGDKADDLAGRLANVRAQFSGLNQLEQTLGRGIIRAGQELSTVVGPTEAESMIRDALNQLEMSREAWRQQGITDPVQIALLESVMTERLIDPMTRIVEEHEEAQREADRMAQRAIREHEAAMKRAAANTEKAFRDAAASLESQLRAIPGLFGTSDVTKEQMELAELGVAQNFADNYLRRLTDEVMNGVDWEGVDIADAARRAGLDEAMDPKAILAIFTQKWRDQSLFADVANLDLFDQEAIRAEMHRQEMSRLGRQNILSMFGLAEDEQGAYFTGLGSFMRDGMMEGAEEGLAEFGRDAVARVVTQLKSDSAIAEYAMLGNEIGTAIGEGLIDSVASGDLVGAIVAKVLEELAGIAPQQ